MIDAHRFDSTALGADNSNSVHGERFNTRVALPLAKLTHPALSEPAPIAPDAVSPYI
eukprot:CAMPEP_0185599116 /NCGR_PEP_ID=MMETSP0434-20130131/82472_1 /TAXON_ID=626734 ORGANISM="Favella taraikaensis, Strain Fe Narragansett Bay" /NCGR_SAMPLE_ID=MMETSP0434 /ASSEMBLY_ACC=CAM_ASM_000379 /LENGTH=56 /DNA_ID=CAMNT_0028228373 /DNA_START=48 /DNA_END=218 /DNA_ORIENTATION=+